MGHARVEAGAVQEGYELLLESLNQMMVVHGPLHQDIAACCRILARLAYVLGDYKYEAFSNSSFCERNVLVLYISQTFVILVQFYTLVKHLPISFEPPLYPNVLWALTSPTLPPNMCV